MRIVSLLPGATEFLFALGLQPVGVSHACDYPPAARDLPSVTRSRVEASATTDVDEQVQNAMADHGAVFEIDADRLDALDPDLVLTQGTCSVCAVDATFVRTTVSEIDASPDVLTVDPHSIDDVLEMGRRIGEAAGIQQTAQHLTADLTNRLATLDRNLPDDDPPSVVVLDWLSPLMVAGHWVPEVVRAAGGRYPLTDPGARSRKRDWASIVRLDPDVLIAAPCGLDVPETVADIDLLTDRPGWSNLDAVRTGQVYAMDGNAFLNRPGPRIVDAAEYLAGLIHPNAVPRPPRSAIRPLVEHESRPAQ